MVSVSVDLRTTRVTSSAYRLRWTAAWPAELAPPTT